MSKNSLYLIVAIAIAATAATFFVTKKAAPVECVTGFADATTQTSIKPVSASDSLSRPVNPTTRGFPLGYYREPLPEDCVAQNALAGGTFNPTHLADDFLIWLIVSILLFLPAAIYKAWRGPRMLGDFGRRA
ncbi:MAG TPA: hypothetical protein VHC21_04145 [Candidatus Saccharimonadales bacterium]|nr:hypothetical protein [Candidatus Saccharimonadales bacterium]